MFTETQKVDIRFFLGYPDIYRFSNPRLENAIDIMGERPETQNKVEVLLSKLNSIYGANPGDVSSIDETLQALGAEEVKDADTTIKFGSSGNKFGGASTNSKLNSLNDYARQLVGALSSWFGVPIASNVFGKAGYVGDSWTRTNGQSNGFGFSTWYSR